MVLIDSNVLIDLFGVDQTWYDWSADATEQAGDIDDLAVTAVAVAEVAPRLGSLEKFLENVEIIGARLVGLTPEAAYAAGRAFNVHRARRRLGNAESSSVLADFFIGGHAQSIGVTILTRDPRFYRAYFPSVPLITPVKDTQ